MNFVTAETSSCNHAQVRMSPGAQSSLRHFFKLKVMPSTVYSLLSLVTVDPLITASDEVPIPTDVSVIAEGLFLPKALPEIFLTVTLSALESDIIVKPSEAAL